MVLVILGIGIVFIIGGFVLMASVDDDLGAVVSGIGLVIVIASLIAAIALGVGVSNLSVIDEKITMYTEENEKIENQISLAVQEYQKYESNIFKEVAPESAVTLVALYPELKADTLVQEQIKIYIKNNETIKELKEKKISGNVLRWWLYFGG